LTNNGNIAELKFALLCIEQGIPVSKPLFDIAKYDMIIDIKGCLLRIQIKSTQYLNKGKYTHYYNCMVSAGSNGKIKYSKNDIDFIAAYVIPEDAWYIIPIEEINTHSIKLYPHRENCNHRYEKYRIQ